MDSFKDSSASPSKAGQSDLLERCQEEITISSDDDDSFEGFNFDYEQSEGGDFVGAFILPKAHLNEANLSISGNYSQYNDSNVQHVQQQPQIPLPSLPPGSNQSRGQNQNNSPAFQKHITPPPTSPPTTNPNNTQKTQPSTLSIPSQSFDTFMSTDLKPKTAPPPPAPNNPSHFSLSAPPAPHPPQPPQFTTNGSNMAIVVPDQPRPPPPNLMKLETLRLTSKDININQSFNTGTSNMSGLNRTTPSRPNRPQNNTNFDSTSSTRSIQQNKPTPIAPPPPQPSTTHFNSAVPNSAHRLTLSGKLPPPPPSVISPTNKNNPQGPPPPPPSGPRASLLSTNQYSTVVPHQLGNSRKMFPAGEAIHEGDDELGQYPKGSISPRDKDQSGQNGQDEHARQSSFLPASSSFSQFSPNGPMWLNDSQDEQHQSQLESYPEDLETVALNENDYGHYHPLEFRNKEIDEKTQKLWRLSYQESRVKQTSNWEYFEEQCITMNVPIEYALRGTKPGQMLILDGIPIRQRAPIWAQLMKIDAAKRAFPTFYEDCLTQLALKPTKNSKDIAKDVKRTMQHHELFRTNDGLEMLSHILSVFSFKYPRIGYCQSMNLLASTLLLFFNEVDSYYMLEGLIINILPECYYTSDLIDVKIDVQIICHYLRKRLPKIYQKIHSFDIDLCSICIPWLMCVYVEILPLETTMRIWDIVIAEGNHTVLFRIALLIFYLHQDLILSCTTMSDLLVLLTSIPSKLIDVDNIINIAHQPICFLTKGQIDKNRKRFKKQIEKEYLKSLKYLNQNNNLSK
jgi:hypothetical protein